VVLAYAGIMFTAAIVGGAWLLAAAALRSHFWEVTGGIILVAGYAGRMVLARWLPGGLRTSERAA
jgi:hypothetical protein